MVLDKLWELKDVGVSFIAIGHTKKKDIEDPMTGETYSILTTNMSNRYFNALKTKLHILGVAYVDREIVQQKTGKKNVVTKQEEIKGKVMNESRRIAFRDDNYSIDAKSRFADIVDNIPMDSDAFIKAITDAIMAEHAKGDKTVEESQKDLEKARKEQEEQIADKLKRDSENKVDMEKNEELFEVFRQKFQDADDSTKKTIRSILKENNIPNLKNLDEIPTAIMEKMVEVLNQEG